MADDAGCDGVRFFDFAPNEPMAGDAGLERADGVIGFGELFSLWAGLQCHNRREVSACDSGLLIAAKFRFIGSW